MDGLIYDPSNGIPESTDYYFYEMGTEKIFVFETPLKSDIEQKKKR